MPKAPPLIEAKVSGLKLTERERREEGHWHRDPKYDIRKDVYFDGDVTINGRKLKFDLHVMSSDGSLKAAKGKWHVSIDVNKPKRNSRTTDYRNRDDIAAIVARCNSCANEHTAVALAEAIFPKLRELGFDVYDDPHHVGGWSLFDMYPDSAKDRGTKNSRRRFYYKQLTEIVCPVHGRFVQEDEESAL